MAATGTTKKIGILFGQENTFPWALIDRVNSRRAPGIVAEPVRIDKVMQGEDSGYAVILDRISQDIPFYRGYLKNAALNGAAVVNNPFWWSADEKFFNNALATKVGVAVPRTVLLPSNQHPPDTNEGSMRNLAYPLDWEAIFSYVGFPAFFKPFAGGGWKSVYKLHDREEFFRIYNETGQLVMMLQEEIVFSEYFRCYCIDRREVRIMQYDPKAPFHLRYVRNGPPVAQELLDKVREGVLELNRALGYDFNTVEFAVRDGVPYAIDFCNPAPDADLHSIGEDNFEWIVEAAANMALRKAQAQVPGKNNLTWGEFVSAFSAPGR
jgi:glutathione synthase/RimK-type ligase-like ATP-grasp enzyme